MLGLLAQLILALERGGVEAVVLDTNDQQKLIRTRAVLEAQRTPSPFGLKDRFLVEGDFAVQLDLLEVVSFELLDALVLDPFLGFWGQMRNAPLVIPQVRIDGAGSGTRR